MMRSRSARGCGGKVKPDVVLFGEFLPEQAMAEATALCEDAELILCVGSSLEVYPVAGLPSVALNRGARLAIVTKGPTPYDRDAVREARRRRGGRPDGRPGRDLGRFPPVRRAAPQHALADRERLFDLGGPLGRERAEERLVGGFARDLSPLVAAPRGPLPVRGP